MSVTHQWINDDKDIMHQVFEGDLTIDVFKHDFSALSHEINEQTHPVDLVIDMYNSPYPPDRVFSLAGFVNQTVSDNQRLVVVVMSGRLMETIIDMAKKLELARRMMQNMYYARSLEDAQDIIMRERAKMA